MARPVRSYGRPGTRVIPADWAASHRPVAEGTMTATAAARKPGTTQTWDDEIEQMVAVPNAPYYEGRCRVQALAMQARPVVVAEDPETVASYLVTLPATAAPAEDDLIQITGSGDPLLDGRTVRVVQVVVGSLIVERDLFCTLTD